MTDRAAPDIEGDQGYPPRPQLTKDEARQKTLREYETMHRELIKQMKQNQEKQALLDTIENHMDQEYINTLDDSLTPRAADKPMQSGIRYIGLENIETKIESAQKQKDI